MKKITLPSFSDQFSSILFFLILTGIATHSFAQPLSGTKTIGSLGTYTTVTAAISAAGLAGVNGPVVFELLPTYLSSGETFPLTIGNINGTNTLNTITIRPQSGATGLSITSANTTATIDLSGSRYIIFDGRPGGVGGSISVSNTSYLTIANTSTSGVAVRMLNDASYNTVQFCDLQGVNSTSGQVPGTPAGIVFIGTTIGVTGNDNNTITGCNIHPPSNSTICTMGVYSYGPSGASSITATFNDTNTVSNCNIFDMFGGASLTTAGIELDKGTNAWNITGNSFFQTTSRSPALTAAVANRAIYVYTANSTGVGNGFNITGNYIGGSAPQCGGTALTINPSGAYNSLFDAITLNVAGGNTSNVKSNTITNLNIAQGAATNDLFHAIWCQHTGNVNVGGPNPSDGNIIGSATTNGAITLTSAGAGLTHNPILVISGAATVTTTILFQYNQVGGITLTGAGNGFSGIFCNATAPTVIIDHNLIGSTTVNNSIYASNTSGSYVLFVNGIRCSSGSATMTITNNIVANLTNNNTSTTTTSGITNTNISQTGGIVITGPTTATQIINSISGNIVKNLSCAAFQTSNYVNTVLVGIGTVAAGGSPTIISNNIVDSLVNTSLSSGSSGQNILMTGIFFYGLTSSTTIINGNFVHSFDLTTNNPGCTFRGIEMIGGPVTASNNMIRLGIKPDGTDLTYPVLIYALLTESSSPHNLYHNSVYIGGSGVTGSDPTYTLWRYNNATDDFRNNVFVNNRSNGVGGTGKHYSMFLLSATTLTLNNNIYYANGTGGVFATSNNGSTDVSAYATNWVTGDANSYYGDPGLVNVTGNAKVVNMHIATPGYKGASVSATGVSTDFDGDIRSPSPDIGADEIPFDLGVSAIDSPTSASFCGKLRPVFVHIKNYGMLTITSANINITVNGSLAISYPWTGSLAPGATSNAINAGNIYFSGGNYKVVAGTALSGNQADNNALNDTVSVSFTVTPAVNPSISISTLNSTVCINSSVTYKAIYSGGGTSPVFQWKKNGNVVGGNDSVYSTNTLANGDSVICVLTSNAPCATQPTLNSNQIKMTVAVTLPPIVTIASADTLICAGASSVFVATPVNGGLTPHYQWKKNGVNVGSDSIAYKLTSPSNKDSVSCMMTSVLSCASKPADTSKYITINVNPMLTPSVAISATSTSFCSGVTDTFTAIVTNGGSAPQFQWKLNNGIPAGSTTNKLIINTLKDKDSVFVIITSNAACLTQALATSTKIGVSVAPLVTPSAPITASKNNICTGESVLFIATPVNGGSSPSKQWIYKGNTLLSGSDSLTMNNLSDKDSIYFVLTSSAACLTSGTYISKAEIISVSSVMVPSVTVVPAATTICSGTNAQFIAKPVNGGSTPHFIWKKNGVTVGNDDTVYTTSSLNNHDSVSVILNGSSPCQTKAADTSAKIIMTVIPSVTPAITVSTNTNIVCQSAATTFTATATNGGTSPHYQWKRNGINIGGDSATLVTSSVNHGDTVYALLTSNATCALSNNAISNKLNMLVIPSSPASVSIAVSANNICKGRAVTFTSAPIYGGTTPHYQWMKNGINIGSDSSNFTTDQLQNNDSVMVLMTSTAQCALPLISSSNKITMNVIPLEIPEVSVTANPNLACSGTNVIFTASDSLMLSSKTHSWYVNGVKTGPDSLIFSRIVATGDIVKCVLMATAQCVSKRSDTAIAVLTINPTPAKPVITRIQDTLISSSANSYQWFLNNNILSGATTGKIKALQNGSYKVTIDNAGCTSTSDTFGFYFLGQKELREDIGTVSIYPNPADESVHVTYQFIHSQTNAVLSVIDMCGRTTYTQTISSEKGDALIPTSTFNSGMYFIQLQSEAAVLCVKKMVITH